MPIPGRDGVCKEACFHISFMKELGIQNVHGYIGEENLLSNDICFLDILNLFCLIIKLSNTTKACETCR